jgi:putative ABC transport system permease protein
MMTITIAWRNIIKHGRRSLVTILTVITGMIGIVLCGGYFQANYTGLRESVIRSQYGHVQIFKSGYESEYRSHPEKVRLDSSTLEILNGVLDGDPAVAVYSRRIETTGLLGNTSQSQAVILRGVDPEQEGLINSALTIVSGNDLTSDDPEGVLLGEGLAQALGAHVGESLTLLGTTGDGTMNGVDVTVTGIFQSFAKEYDDRAMIGTLERTRELTGSPDVDKIVVLLNETEQIPAFLGRLQAAANEKGLQLEFKTWDQLATFYQRVVELYDSFFWIILMIVVVIILFGISNTMSMAVLERTREIGVLRALGTKRRGILKLFLAEGAMLAIIGSILGIALGCFLAWLITRLSIMMPPPPGSAKGYPLSIEYVPLIAAFSSLLILVVALLSSFLPARKASSQQIVEALRFV